jgi:hypothetical protein
MERQAVARSSIVAAAKSPEDLMAASLQPWSISPS